MTRAVLLILCLASIALCVQGQGRDGAWTLKAVKELPVGVQTDEAWGMLKGDTQVPSGPPGAIWFLGEIHQPGDWVVTSSEVRHAEAWASTRGGHWRPLPQIRPARCVAFDASTEGAGPMSVLLRIPTHPTAVPVSVEAISSEHFSKREWRVNGLMACMIGALAWIFFIGLYMRLRLRRWRVEGLIWMSALVLVNFLMRSGGFHIMVDAGLSGIEQPLELLVEAASFPWAIWAMQRARPADGLNRSRLMLRYLIAWVFIAAGNAFDFLPSAWALGALHALYFGFGVHFLGQIHSRPTPLQLTFLIMVLVEGGMAFGALVNVAMGWSIWMGTFLALLGLTWSLVRVVNEGFAVALGLAEEKRQAQAQEQRAYARGLEEEKRRIAGELHDDILGGLVLLQHGLPQNDPVRMGLHGVTAKIRGLTANLSPHGVVNLDFSDALERLVHAYRSKTLDVWLHLHGAPAGLTEHAHFELFRMAQEVLQNVYKHAGADRVDISLDFEASERTLLLTMEDNGVGFDLATVEKRSGGLGLDNLKSRAHSIGAQLHIESSPGSGTYISIEYNTEGGSPV